MKETTCAEKVWAQGEYHAHLCRLKAGFGPDGLYCKHHGKKRDAKNQPVYTMYVTDSYGHKIGEISVVSHTEKGYMNPNGYKSSRKTRFVDVFETREEAVEFILERYRKKLERNVAEAEKLLKDYKEFSRKEGKTDE